MGILYVCIASPEYISRHHVSLNTILEIALKNEYNVQQFYSESNPDLNAAPTVHRRGFPQINGDIRYCGKDPWPQVVLTPSQRKSYIHYHGFYFTAQHARPGSEFLKVMDAKVLIQCDESSVSVDKLMESHFDQITIEVENVYVAIEPGCIMICNQDLFKGKFVTRGTMKQGAWTYDEAMRGRDTFSSVMPSVTEIPLEELYPMMVATLTRCVLDIAPQCEWVWLSRGIKSTCIAHILKKHQLSLPSLTINTSLLDTTLSIETEEDSVIGIAVQHATQEKIHVVLTGHETPTTLTKVKIMSPFLSLPWKRLIACIQPELLEPRAYEDRMVDHFLLRRAFQLLEGIPEDIAFY